MANQRAPPPVSFVGLRTLPLLKQQRACMKQSAEKNMASCAGYSEKDKFILVTKFVKKIRLHRTKQSAKKI